MNPKKGDTRRIRSHTFHEKGVCPSLDDVVTCHDFLLPQHATEHSLPSRRCRRKSSLRGISTHQFIQFVGPSSGTPKKKKKKGEKKKVYTESLYIWARTGRWNGSLVYISMYVCKPLLCPFLSLHSHPKVPQEKTLPGNRKAEKGKRKKTLYNS